MEFHATSARVVEHRYQVETRSVLPTLRWTMTIAGGLLPSGTTLGYAECRCDKPWFSKAKTGSGWPNA
jgi:hypothetical protein